jgi:hypothetical protein
MKKLILYLLISIFLALNSYSALYPEDSNPDYVNDGPYIFNENGTFTVKWIINNLLKKEYINPQNFTGLKDKFNLLFDYRDLTDTYLIKSNYSQIYSKIDSISVISDIHGEYDCYINLLKALGIIDNSLNWKFGKGHLVILGDVFDRGEKVTEVLWHLFGLEKQAAKAGGMVHVMLGNHEIMVFSKDFRFINEKYVKASSILNTEYSDLYSENSVLGKWLRSKPIMITINDILFVHGGISMELVNRKLSISKINQMFSDSIVGKEMIENDKNEEQMFLNDDYGPIWYRGYFKDSEFCETRLDSILGFFEKKHIVVGHTPSRDIKSHYNNKILGIDAGIVMDQPGEMLIYKNGVFYKGYFTGKRIKI